MRATQRSRRRVLAIGLSLACALPFAPDLAAALESSARSTSGSARTEAETSSKPRRAAKRRAKKSDARRAADRRAYQRMRARWHRRAPAGEVRAWRALEPPPLVLRPIGQKKDFALRPVEEELFGEDACSVAREAFVSKRDGTTRDIHPRLLTLVYRAARRFQAPYVHVISGFRDTRSTSRHAQGRAIDFVLPGVPDRKLAAYLRTQGFVGVGIYPNSGFVHLDVRSRSYFWVDRSGPGEPSKVRTILPKLVAKVDAEAARRGETPTPELDGTGEEENLPASTAEEIAASE